MSLFEERQIFRCIVYVHPEPQGSAKAFVVGKRAVVTSDNKKLKPYRSEVTRVALSHCVSPTPLAGKHVPVTLYVDFYIDRPQSAPKKRVGMIVKPDLDKLVRATLDALTGVIYVDDAQVVSINARKMYGSPERVEITAHY